MADILVDTDIIIEYLRSRDKSSTALIGLLQEHRLFISPISELELYLGARTDRHRTDLELIFSESETIPFEMGCGKTAAGIWRKLESAHQHTEIRDVFIASVAIHNDMWLHTYNEKHFRAIDGLKLWK